MQCVHLKICWIRTFVMPAVDLLYIVNVFLECYCLVLGHNVVLWQNGVLFGGGLVVNFFNMTGI